MRKDTVIFYKSKFDKKLALATADVGAKKLKLALASADVGAKKLKLALASADVGAKKLKLALASADVGAKKLKLALASADVGAKKLKLTLASADVGQKNVRWGLSHFSIPHFPFSIFHFPFRLLLPEQAVVAGGYAVSIAKQVVERGARAEADFFAYSLNGVVAILVLQQLLGVGEAQVGNVAFEGMAGVPLDAVFEVGFVGAERPRHGLAAQLLGGKQLVVAHLLL